MIRSYMPAACALAVLSSCASAPEAIRAQNIPAQPYIALSCGELSTRIVQSSQAYEAAAADQRKAQQGDALGVFLIGVPVSSMAGGDKEADISYRKGEMQALREAARQKGCVAT